MEEHPYTECPKCNHKKITLLVQEPYFMTYSLTGKLLKRDRSHDSHVWHYQCKCGWVSEGFTQ